MKFLAIAPLLALAICACPGAAPSHVPLARCADACAERAKARCDRAACERGCAFVLDRVVEREHLAVIDCVAARSESATPEGSPRDEWRDAKCADREWAGCAAQIGVHADGGPPAPPPVDERPRD